MPLTLRSLLASILVSVMGYFMLILGAFLVVLREGRITWRGWLVPATGLIVIIIGIVTWPLARRRDQKLRQLMQDVSGEEADLNGNLIRVPPIFVLQGVLLLGAFPFLCLFNPDAPAGWYWALPPVGVTLVLAGILGLNKPVQPSSAMLHVEFASWNHLRILLSYLIWLLVLVAVLRAGQLLSAAEDEFRRGVEDLSGAIGLCSSCTIET